MITVDSNAYYINISNSIQTSQHRSAGILQLIWRLRWQEF